LVVPIGGPIDLLKLRQQKINLLEFEEAIPFQISSVNEVRICWGFVSLAAQTGDVIGDQLKRLAIMRVVID
jgi:hypothetical protein